MTSRTFIAVLALGAALATPVMAADPQSANAGPESAGAAVVDPPAEPWNLDAPSPPTLPATAARDERGRLTARAVRVSDRPRVDGRLDERIYTEAEPIGGFIQTDPVEGAPATERTEVWIFFDGSNVYVGGRCWDSAPESRWVANEMRRDSGNLGQNDSFTITLDTFYDRRNGYIFQITPIGGFYDGELTNSQNNLDWNPVWTMQSGRFEGGWTFEMAIPFRSLRYKPGRTQIWGVNMRRVVFWKNENSFSSPVPASFGRSGIFQVSLGGTLVGVEVPPARSNIELKPYAIGGVTTDRSVDRSADNTLSRDAGFDAKYGITQNLTADFTYNTDFAQVETDEQQVNLTRFGLFFPEKREFFLEGRGNFAFAGQGGGGGGGGDTPTVFFSRQIGLTRGRPVPIVAGGRVTGKVGRYSVGLLNIQTDDVSGLAVPTNFAVMRVKRDVLRRSSIGGILTRRSQSLVGNGANTAYGLDAAFGFKDDVNVNAYVAGTDTPGRQGRDLSYRGDFSYAGDRYGAEVERLVIEEQFNPEIGFIRRPNMRKTYAYGRFSPRPRSIRAVRKFYFEGNVSNIENNAHVLETRESQATFTTDFQNSNQFRIAATKTYELLTAPFRIATGIAIPPGGYDFGDVQATYTVGQQQRVSGAVNVTRGTFYDGDLTSFGVTRGRIGLTPKLAVEPGVSFNWIDLPQGSFSTTLVQNRVVYTMSPRMFVTGFVQYNSSNSTMAANFRLRWEYLPGSEIFVVYTDERDTALGGFPYIRNRAFVVKANHLLRF